MTHKMPLIMGAMMGVMVPWMIHSERIAQSGAVFVAAHLAIIAAAGGLALLFPKIRAHLPRHRPNMRHAGFMLAAFAIGWAAVCVFCLIVGGEHWT